MLSNTSEMGRECNESLSKYTVVSAQRMNEACFDAFSIYEAKISDSTFSTYFLKSYPKTF